MTYPEAIQYLESFVNYERKDIWQYKSSLKLERVEGFFRALGNLQKGLRFVQVAGSKGKGSTCTFIAYILREAGYKVGLYTSPHLIDFRERIRILTPRSTLSAKRYEFEGMISKKELSGLTGRLRPVIEKFHKTSLHGQLSFFEAYTAIAVTYFKEKQVDIAVLETGMGGRFDATNVVESLACAITPISYEHTQYLGRTLKEISREKSGIIKSKKLVVISAPQKREAMLVIGNRCKEVGAMLYKVGRDIIYRKKKDDFDVHGITGEYIGLKTNLIGEHQMVNASVALGVIETLKSYGFKVSLKNIREGLLNAKWPVRCEVVSQEPLTILDGAQNVASVMALKKAVTQAFKYKRLILILGISSDKDKIGICRQLESFADEIILTRADNPRATAPQELAGYFKRKDIHITQGVKEANVLARHLAKEEDLILACGSLFVAGELRNEIIR